MPWEPTTDFEEEVINLQPHHDFIYGVLSEPQPSYPRPKSHTDYAFTKKLQEKEQQREYEATGKINEKLRIIQQVQSMANTKPVGEQPTLEDWENNEKLEQETIGLMRYCGMAASVDQPLNEKVTIATFPVENTNKIVKNGRRRVALFFDANVFKLHEKASPNTTDFESFNSGSNDSEENKNQCSTSELESNTSFNTSSSFSVNSFDAAKEWDDSFSSVSSCKKSPLAKINEQRLYQYEKLLEDTSSLSLNRSVSQTSNRSNKQNFDSFETAEENSSWTPIFEDEDLICKEENWPALSKEKNSRDIKPLNDKTQNESTDDISIESSSSKQGNRVNFLDRFIKSENVDTLDTTSNSTSTTSREPKTYASIAKPSKVKIGPPSKQVENKSFDYITDFPPYYTTRRMYALKRNLK